MSLRSVLERRRDPLEPYGFSDLLILPTQIRSRSRTGVERLLAALIESALHDTKSPDQAIRRTAVAWLLGEIDAAYSFEQALSVFGINVEWVRPRLARYLDRARELDREDAARAYRRDHDRNLAVPQAKRPGARLHRSPVLSFIPSA